MKGETVQVRQLGLMQTDRPQRPESATLVDNWRVDPRTKGLTSRIGYEKYRVGASSQWAPFTNLGRVDSLFVHQQSAGGARQSILFEADGSLYLYYEVGGANELVKLAERSIPTATQSASQYATFGDRVIVTNGEDAPLVIRPWPLPRAASITDAMRASIVRPLGFYGRPAAPQTLKVATIDASSGGESTAFYTGASTTNWYPAHPLSINFPSAFGMGLHIGGTDGATNDFEFRVSFINDTGSESPLSLPAEVTWEIPAGHKGYRYAPTIRIPIGPPGTRARRIYATTNEGSEFFFVADVRNNVEQLFHAFRRSASFSTAAPSIIDSVPFPAPKARCCAVYKDCLFLDGGVEQGAVLFFSRPGLIDQYSAADYITLTSGGGAVTGMYAYYNNLVVFRENSIDVLTGAYPNFTVQTVTKQVVCRSPSSIEAVPGLGLVFLAQDGVYRLSGGLDGGSILQVENIGNEVQDELERMTSTCTARAVGRYSPTERAYHLYLAVDGNDRPNLGLVYAIDKGGWSIRTGFPVGCIDRTYNGELIFGHHTGGTGNEAGLFVVSSARRMGSKLDGDVFTAKPACTSVYESAWHDFGDAQVKKQPQYVTLWAYTTGTVSLKFSFYKDYEYTAVHTDKRYVAQSPDQAEQPVYDEATLGTDAWQDARLVPIRVACAMQSCSWFKFRLETSDDVLFVGYEVEYKARGTQVIAGRLG